MRLRITSIPAGWLRAMERVALGLLGLALLLSAGGVAMKGVKRKSPAALASVMPSAAPPAKPPASVPEADAYPPSAVAGDVMTEAVAAPASRPKTKPGSLNARRNNGLQLRSSGSFAVLALAEATAAELRKEPGRLGELVESGLLFSVPNHTTVVIEEAHGGLAKVRILDAAMEGRVGWVRANQVAAR